MLSTFAYVQTHRTVHFMYVLCLLSHVPLFVMLWIVACQTPLSVGFFWQEYCSGLPLSSSWALPDPGVKPESPVAPAQQAESLPAEPQGKP